MMTQIQEPKNTNQAEEIQFRDIAEEIGEAIARLQNLQDDFSNWEKYYCEGDCSESEYQEAAAERLKKLRKIIFGLMVDSGLHRQMVDSAPPQAISSLSEF